MTQKMRSGPVAMLMVAILTKRRAPNGQKCLQKGCFYVFLAGDSASLGLTLRPFGQQVAHMHFTMNDDLSGHRRGGHS